MEAALGSAATHSGERAATGALEIGRGVDSLGHSGLSFIRSTTGIVAL